MWPTSHYKYITRFELQILLKETIFFFALIVLAMIKKFRHLTAAEAKRRGELRRLVCPQQVIAGIATLGPHAPRADPPKRENVQEPTDETWQCHRNGSQEEARRCCGERIDARQQCTEAVEIERLFISEENITLRQSELPFGCDSHDKRNYWCRMKLWWFSILWSFTSWLCRKLIRG